MNKGRGKQDTRGNDDPQNLKKIVRSPSLRNVLLRMFMMPPPQMDILDPRLLEGSRGRDKPKKKWVTSSGEIWKNVDGETVMDRLGYAEDENKSKIKVKIEKKIIRFFSTKFWRFQTCNDFFFFIYYKITSYIQFKFKVYIFTCTGIMRSKWVHSSILNWNFRSYCVIRKFSGVLFSVFRSFYFTFKHQHYSEIFLWRAGSINYYLLKSKNSL